MSTLTLAGDLKSALTHFALIGLARLCENAGIRNVRVCWSNEAVPRAQLILPTVEQSHVADLILSHAQRLTGDDQWPQALVNYGVGRKPARFSPFSPRIRAIDPVKDRGDWKLHQETRHKHIDALQDAESIMDLRFLGALGEAAYWRFDNGAPRPDHGASRWEMKTRNRGEEFVQHRFSGLCDEVARRDREQILNGLTGGSIRDIGGKEDADSRTSTGLTPPRPVDASLALAGILGISAFPLSHQISRLSVTPCAYPVRSLHPQLLVLPVPFQEMTMARLQSILVSRELALVVAHRGRLLDAKEPFDASEELELEAAHRWLRSRGVPGVVEFPILKTGSSSAPERQILSGTAVPHGI